MQARSRGAEAPARSPTAPWINRVPDTARARSSLENEQNRAACALVRRKPHQKFLEGSNNGMSAKQLVVHLPMDKFRSEPLHAAYDLVGPDNVYDISVIHEIGVQGIRVRHGLKRVLSEYPARKLAESTSSRVT